jgi:signal transduction histidine kinase
MFTSQKLFWLTIACCIYQSLVLAQLSWQDTFEIYLKTPPNESIIGFERALANQNIPDTSRFDMMTALVNDYAQLRQVDSARSMAVKVYQFSKELTDKGRQARAALSRAWTAREHGLSEEVLEMALNAEQIAKELNRGDLLLMSYNTIASVYYDVKNDSLQKIYLEKSIETAVSYGIEIRAFNAMTNLGYIYLKEKNYPKAKSLIQQSIQADKKFNNGNQISLYMPYSHMIDIYEVEEKYDSCAIYVQKLLDISKGAGWPDYVVLNELTLTFFRKQAGIQVSYNPSLVKQLNAIVLTGKSIDEQKNFLWQKTRINQDFGDYKTALKYRTDFYELTDSLNQAELRDQIAFYKEQFDAEQRENQITQLENENAIAGLEAAQLSTRNTWLVIGISLFGILSTLLIYFYLKLRKTTEELRKLNQLKDKFFAIVSHDLRNSITAFHGIGRVIDKYIAQEKWDRLTKLAMKLDDESSKLHGFLNDLLNWSLTQVDQVPYNPENVLVKERTDRIISLMEAQLVGKSITINSSIDTGVQSYVDPNAFDLAIRNLLSNALKFSHENGQIELAATTSEGNVQISIQDFGVGMSREQTDQLFQIGTKSRRGTKGESGSGIGLVLVKEFVELNKGSIRVESQPEKGTTFTIQFPKA